MSRVGKAPVPLPSGVTCTLDGKHATIKGPKGTLELDIRPEIGVALEENVIVVTRPDEAKKTRAFHGMTRALLNNMVKGVSDGFEKTLVIEGVGYRCSLQGTTLNLQVGYSHPVTMDPPEGITFTVDGTQTIKVTGVDRQQVGQVAADIRGVRKPEPYKGKGIRYADETVRRKVGKSGK